MLKSQEDRILLSGVIITLVTAIIITTVTVITTVALLGIIIYHNGQAQLQACERDGLAECHLEWDGLELNAYGKQL